MRLILFPALSQGYACPAEIQEKAVLGVVANGCLVVCKSVGLGVTDLGRHPSDFSAVRAVYQFWEEFINLLKKLSRT